jgi:lysophospholipase L1-like esterase
MNLQRSCSLVAFLASVAAEVALPNDRRLAYVGRISHEGMVSRFGWAATQILATFTGSSISANLSGSFSADRYLAVIDGQPHQPFTKQPGWEVCKLAEGLSASKHTLALWKISEDGSMDGEKGVSSFGGLSADSFLDAPQMSQRRLEFIGDSDTVGYCADQTPGWIFPDMSISKYENAYEAWSRRVAHAFGADLVNLGISGYGVTEKGETVQAHIGNLLPFSDAIKFDFSAWIPDAVVILIGANDDDNDTLGYVDAYRRMLELVVHNYAGAAVKPKLINVCGGSIDGLDACESIQKANQEFNANRTDGFQSFYTTITTDHWWAMNGPGSRINHYKGCMGHYSAKGHEVLAGDIIPQIGQIMSWNTPEDAFVV